MRDRVTSTFKFTLYCSQFIKIEYCLSFMNVIDHYGKVLMVVEAEC